MDSPRPSPSGLRDEVTRAAGEVARRLSLDAQRGDWIFAAGSVVEGLGNATSDLDLYVVTSGERLLAGRTPWQSIDAGGRRIDLEVLGAGELEALASRFEAWASGPELGAASFAIAERERLTLHRLATAVHAWGEPVSLASLECLVTPQRLARHKVAWASAWISTLQADLEGLRHAGDWQALVPVGNELAGHAMDALLAAHGWTNPAAKWRLPLLRRLPAAWDHVLPGRLCGLGAAETFLQVLASPWPLSADLALRRTNAVVTMARRVLPWAQRAVLGPSAEPLPSGAHVGTAGPRLPPLGLGVQIAFQGGKLHVADVSRRGYSFEVAGEIAAALCFFDGVSSIGSVRDALGGLERLAQARAIIEAGGFHAAPLVDAQQIERLIAPRGGLLCAPAAAHLGGAR